MAKFPSALNLSLLHQVIGLVIVTLEQELNRNYHSELSESEFPKTVGDQELPPS